MSTINDSAEDSTAVNAAEWSPQFDEILHSHLSRCAPGTAIPPEAPLVDLGLDSLKTVTLLIAIEDAFGITFPDQLLASNTFGTATSLWSGVLKAAAHCGVAIAV